jgi:hypothetical protein
VATLLSAGQTAQRLGVRPRDVSDLFYTGVLREDICPVIAGRRLIPEHYLPQVAAALYRRRRIVRPEETART